MLIREVDERPFRCIAGEISVDVFKADDDVKSFISIHKGRGNHAEICESISSHVDVKSLWFFVISFPFGIDEELKGPFSLHDLLTNSPFFGVSIRRSNPDKKTFSR